MTKFFTLLISSLLLVLSVNAKEIRYRINAAELTQLNQFYQQCGGPNWTNNTGWPLPEGEQTIYPEAYGLTFKDTTIQDDDNLQLIEISCRDIDLGGNQLSDNIPNFNLPDLELLYLNDNQLSGSIPNFNLLYLTELDLSKNQLSGSIPNFNLPKLLWLDLNDNHLCGSIPNFNLTNLQYLVLNSNQLSGNIPNFNMTNLQYLLIQNNKLTFNEINNYSEYTKLYNFNYSPQDTILNLVYNTITKELTVLTEGDNNQYRWLKGTDFYKTTNENHITLPEGENPKSFTCEVTNTVLTGLTLKTGEAEIISYVEDQLNSQLQVSPQPATDYINIDCYLDNLTDVKIELYDMSGQCVYKQTFENGGQSFIIPVKTLNSGNYSLVVQSGNKTYTQKVLISR